MAYEFYLGIDASDEDGPVTLSLVEKAVDDDESKAVYRVHRVERFPDGHAPEERLPDHIQDLIDDAPYTGRTVLVVNRSGKNGREIARQLEDQGMSPVNVILTGGDTAANADDGLAVSEHEVVSQARELYRAGRIDLEDARAEDGASELAHGLQDYESRSHEAGEALNDITAAPRRRAAHAGFVLSAAVACWLGEQHRFDVSEHLEGDPPPVGPAKRKKRPDTTDALSAMQENAKNT